MGLAQGSLAAVRLLKRTGIRRFRSIWLSRRPLKVHPEELRVALGGLTAEQALRGPARAALPTVVAFEDSLASLSKRQREELLRRADVLVAHVFDLLGSGPADLGPQIDWQRDFKSGRAWPVRHFSRLRISYPDASDIKVPWELSRFQHLPLLAAAFRLTGEQRYLDEVGVQLRAWIDTNPVEFGVNWVCTMDVAIRAANWVAALVLIAGDAGGAAVPWLDDVFASLLLHGRFIRSHLEWAPTRGNHYLADVVGLLSIAAIFSSGAEGHTWSEWAAGEVVAEIEHQVRADGCDHEASIPYHRLVSELFICGFQAADALVPGSVPPWARQRLERMLGFTVAYTRPDGIAPQIGDGDDGRFLPLADYGTLEHQRHDHLFAQACHRPTTNAGCHTAFPDGGWFVMRSGSLHAVIRCGDVGVGGLGCHAHCDLLAFELSFAEQPLVVDPGSYLYTSDMAARAAFRATAMHATLEIDGVEQNPIRVERPFQLEDRANAEMLVWQEDGARARFVGRHHGYERLEQPVTHQRQIDFDGDAGTVVITDTVCGDGSHTLRWSLPLAPGRVELDEGAAVARFPSGVGLAIQAPELRFELADSWYSPSYGVRHQAPVLHARERTQPGEHSFVLAMRVLLPSDR
jgi:uncharacterized heparinase superfamily protein